MFKIRKSRVLRVENKDPSGMCGTLLYTDIYTYRTILYYYFMTKYSAYNSILKPARAARTKSRRRRGAHTPAVSLWLIANGYNMVSTCSLVFLSFLNTRSFPFSMSRQNAFIDSSRITPHAESIHSINIRLCNDNIIAPRIPTSCTT